MIVAQITDTHIKASGLAYRRVDTSAALAACVRQVAALRPRVDVVLVTGDLTDFGRPEEYRALRALLAPLQMPCLLIPGNHDDRTALRREFSDHGYLPDSGFLHYTVDDYPIRLIGLDTVVDGAPHGELCERRLRWLQERLQEAPREPTLLFMHHPPFVTGIGHMDRQNCRNGEHFGALLERNGQVKALLCGHVHRPVHTVWHGVHACVGPSPSHAVHLDLTDEGPAGFMLEPPGFQILTFGPDGQPLVHLSHIGQFDGPHPFFDAQGRLID